MAENEKVLSRWNRKNAIRLENETDEEYQVRQSYYMENHRTRIEVAFQKAEKKSMSP